MRFDTRVVDGSLECGLMADGFQTDFYYKEGSETEDVYEDLLGFLCGCRFIKLVFENSFKGQRITFSSLWLPIGRIHN